MKVSKIPGLGRFGIIIDGLDLATVSADQWIEIGQLHLQNLVTIIRNANCTKDRFAELVTKFGDPRYVVRMVSKFREKYNKSSDWVHQKLLEDSELIDQDDRNTFKISKAVTEVTNDGIVIGRVAGGYDDEGNPRGFFSDGELLWHSNESGTLTFTPGLALLGYTKTIGSATGFLTTPDYYESVSESFRSELGEMTVLHRFIPGKMNPGLRADMDRAMKDNMVPEDDTEVPMVIKSPGGITGLHFPVHTVHRIKGMSKKDSDAVFEEISKNLLVDKYIYDHWYKNDNDLLLFDNSITLHRRLGNIDGRTCYRLPHDYTHLQDGPYLPYHQPEIAKRYSKEIREAIKTTGIRNFKLPKKAWHEYLPFVN